MDIDTAQKTRPASARRRLLRGVFSVPAALTLYSGGAIAAASSQQCVMNQQTNWVDPVPSVTTTNETYVRIGLYQQSNGNTYWIRGSELHGFVLAATFNGWPSSTQFQKFDDAHNKFSGGPENSVNNLATEPSKWAVLRIDGNGTVVGVGESGLAGGSAIHHSCWASFHIARS